MRPALSSRKPCVAQKRAQSSALLLRCEQTAPRAALGNVKAEHEGDEEARDDDVTEAKHAKRRLFRAGVD